MSTINITRTYQDGTLLYAEDFDNLCDGSETFLNTTRLNGDNIATDGITGGLKFTDTSISTAKIANSSATTAKFEDAAVTTAKINDAAVTTAKINDAAVTTAKINDGAVTYAKLASSNIVTSASSGTGAATTDVVEVSPGSYAYVISNLTVTITTSGKPVLAHLGPANDGTSSRLLLRGWAVWLYLYRDSTRISYLGGDTDSGVISSKFIDSPTEGTYTYRVAVFAPSLEQANSSSIYNNLVLTCVEL